MNRSRSKPAMSTERAGRSAPGPARLRRALLSVTCALLVPAPTEVMASPPSAPDHDEDRFSSFERALHAWQLGAARGMLPTLHAKQRDPGSLLRHGLLALYEADYERCEALLAEALTTGDLSSREQERALHHLALARGAREALKDAVTLRSDDGRFEAVFANPLDQPLAPYLFAAMDQAYNTLGDDIGVRPSAPIRFEILDDPAKLALITPLSLDAIYTTGTVGITKYRRVMMVSPRVMLYGYGWIDTAVHEYVHYLVTLRTGNAAPVWLQEGLAKLLESRWRRASPPPLDPRVASLLHKALIEDELITLQQMHPSIAMLPSQEKAALAYAEVETMLGLLYEQRGSNALSTVMDALAAGENAETAIARAWGGSFENFQQTWKMTYRKRTASTPQAQRHGLPRRQFRGAGEEGGADPSLAGDVFSHLGGGRARQLARLGVLLTLRGHKEAAVLEYEKARATRKSVARDPKLARRLGDLYLELDRPAQALPLLVMAGVDDPDNANIAAAEGRARLRSGDLKGARVALLRATQVNPFVPTLPCDLALVAVSDAERRREQARCSE